MTTEHPRIRIEALCIEVIDLRPAQNAVRAKYGPRYHVSDNCLREIAILWGIEQPQGIINDAGVFKTCKNIRHRAGRCRAELHLAASSSGLWAMDTSYAAALSGGGASPSVWNPVAFLSEQDARVAGLHELLTRFRAIAASGMPEAAEARTLTDLLVAERMPQLSLF